MAINASKVFLEWLSNRLIFKYHEKDAEIIDGIKNIINNKQIIDITIDTAIIEKLCRKYHADWDFDESELSFGHSDESRNQIRSHMKNIIKDYMYEICLTR
jgi:hypothetical protein